ncbi:MAG: hypothetical protein OEZ51_12525 [Nitrospinota bacterium]|nr:hypothetical protein [Nitrospinota bacterium]
MTEQETTPQQQPAPEEALKTEIPAPEDVEADDSEEKEEEIDLNHLFPDAETDLNELFPEPEMRSLLKKVRRNTKDLGKMKERFSESFSEPDSD